MTRITSLLTIPLAIVFGLTLGATSAAAGHSRSNCEQRIFQKDETEACFTKNGEIYLFLRAPTTTLAPGGSTSVFGLVTGGSLPVEEFACGCQLRNKYNLICADGAKAVIGSVDRRGKKLVGETFAVTSQTKIYAHRAPLEDCL